MAIDKAVDSAALDALLSDIGDAIREKNGETSLYDESVLASKIRDISTGVQVQIASGTTRFTSGNATISLNFIPDILTIMVYNVSGTYKQAAGFDFSYSDMMASAAVNANENFVYFRAKRTNKSVAIMGTLFDANGSSSRLSGSYSYKAYTFT